MTCANNCARFEDHQRVSIIPSALLIGNSVSFVDRIVATNFPVNNNNNNNNNNN
jgi:hypothetical protein